MTDVMEQGVAEALADGWHLNRDGRPCGTATHDTQWSFRNGCRSAEAAQAKAAGRNHTAGTDGLSAQRRAKRILNPAPECPAERHHATFRAYRDGCRCPAAVIANQQNLDQMREYRRTRESQEARDPRAPWRTERMRCGRMDLFLLLHGAPQVDRATGRNVNTQTEKMVAVLRWTGKLRLPNGQLYTDKDLGRLMGVTGTTVAHLREEPAKRRATRTQRRLAEAQWRAMRNARLVSRG